MLRRSPVLRSVSRSCFVIFAFSVFLFSASAKKKPPAAPINLNTATSEELQLVPGFGPVTAEKILPMRKSYGAFKSVDDLSAIRGIGPKRLEGMRKYLTVRKPAPSKSAQPQQQQPQPSPPKIPPSESLQHQRPQYILSPASN
jgi:competence ComEA-like helix-hairpin-helix protein